ncbi:MAG: hypothetical protein IJW19_00005, partial [Clostridia bacterium]|nr:hypothetical protein [Clostridia bacterium]
EAPDTVPDASAPESESTDGGTASEEPKVDEGDGDTDLKEYLMEKIAPIAAGVITSLLALATTIKRIKGTISTLNSSTGALNDVKEAVADTLEGVKSELKNGISEIEKKISDIPELKEDYEMLKNEYKTLKEQNALLMEAFNLGFASIPDAVRSGNARKIAIVSDKFNEVSE